MRRSDERRYNFRVLFVLIARDQLLHAIRLAHGPWFAEEPPVHARKKSLPLAQFRCEKGHALNVSGIIQSPGINESERRSTHQIEELLLGSGIIADNVNVADTVSVKPRLVEHFPPHVLESANHARTGKA